MSINQFLTSLDLFKDQNIDIELLKSQGLNNISYLLKTGDKSYVVRVFKNKKSVNISRDFEFQAQLKAFEKNIAAKPIFINNNFMIYEFLDGYHKINLNNKNIKKLAITIDKLHKIELKSKKYNLFKDLKIYKKQLKDSKSTSILLDLEKDIKKLKNYKKELALVHHDLNSKNILFLKNSIKIIDWEYAGTNDIYFDLATICIEFNLDKKQEKLFLKNYFKNKKKESKKKLKIYKNIYKNICSLWFMRHSSKLI